MVTHLYAEHLGGSSVKLKFDILVNFIHRLISIDMKRLSVTLTQCILGF